MMVSKHVRLTDDVDTLMDAWAFIMQHVDEFAAPSIGIEPYNEIVQDVDGTYEDGRTAYAVSIHGHVNA